MSKEEGEKKRKKKDYNVEDYSSSLVTTHVYNNVQ
jgi:hypothetical protein